MSIDKITQGDGETKSLDLVTENINKIKELFPEVVTEGKIDFKVLQEILGEEIEEGEEYYRFTWAGKAQARREAHKPSTGTLRPCKEESVDWDTTQNLYIEGDNLEVLKLMQKSYANKVKMIYIDPPYNTGKDFVYKDNYKDNLKNYQQVTGQVDDEGNKLSTNSESDGRYHSNWLNMMYPRLRLARNLLKEDGLIFISIDDNEVNNLIKCCNEIFGEENFVSQLVWENKEGGGGSDSKLFRIKHEYILVFARSIQFTEIDGVPITNEERYTLKDEFEAERGSYYLQKLGMGSLGYIESLDYPIAGPDGEIYPNNDNRKINRWRWGKDKVEWGIKNKFIEFRKDSNNNWQVYTKQYLNMDNEGNIIQRTNRPLAVINEFSSTQANKSLQKIFSEKVFDYPKPVELIQYLIKLNAKNNDIILDFFSGSASSAHAVINVNLLDEGRRQFFQVQLPEPTDEKSEAFKAGYKTIAEIGKERIRRACKKIAEENPDKAKDLDLGFKVFKLDSSNIKGWDGTTKTENGLEVDTKKQLEAFEVNIKEDRTEEDILFEILLKYGLDLTLPIEEKVMEGKKVFNVGFGALFICLADGITNKVAEGIGAWKQELNPATCRVIFKDSGFTDVEKANAVQTLKKFGINEVKSI